MGGMRVVFAPDSFKECLSARDVAECLAAGWREVRPGDDLRLVPMADGGEGTLDALVAATGGEARRHVVTGPLGEPVAAAYGLLGDGVTAIVEMAAASGLPLAPATRRDPTHTTTRGTGELIRHALEAGARRILVGLGGSATNDGGAGMAQALGFRLLDEIGEDLPPGGAALARLHAIDAAGRFRLLAGCTVLAACDVDNPLCGPNGASAVYGPQKGATPAMVARLDDALRHFARVVARDLGVDMAGMPGAGAAGGLGGGLVAFLGAELQPGAGLVAEAAGLDAHLRGADLVITGEGRIDAQTAHGKTPAGVARAAKEYGLPVIAVAGCVGPGYEAILGAGMEAVHALSGDDCPAEKAIAEARVRLQALARELAAAYGRE